MKMIGYCGNCADYDPKKHRCKLGCNHENDPRSKFYDDCPLQDGVPAKNWIPANKPPEKYSGEDGELIPFLVCEDGTEYPFRAFYDGKIWGDGTSVLQVKYWMPLPEPPKEG